MRWSVSECVRRISHSEPRVRHTECSLHVDVTYACHVLLVLCQRRTVQQPECSLPIAVDLRLNRVLPRREIEGYLWHQRAFSADLSCAYATRERRRIRM